MYSITIRDIGAHRKRNPTLRDRVRRYVDEESERSRTTSLANAALSAVFPRELKRGEREPRINVT